MNLSEFLPADIKFSNIVLDSREIKPGNLFIGVPGHATDGRKYLAHAIKNGAVAALIESPYQHEKHPIPVIYVPNLQQHLYKLANSFYKYPSQNMKIIGVTGTNGKTSCCHYFTQLLNNQQIPCGMIGTLGVGVLSNLQSTELTTPNCFKFQQQLQKFYDHNIQHVITEVSSHALQQNRVSGTQFEIGVFTNLSRDHLDYHKTMREYFKAKLILFKEFKPKYAVINIDDPYGLKLLQEIDPSTQILSYSICKSADVYINNKIIYTPWGTEKISHPLLGKFNESNLLACIACTGILGLPLKNTLNEVNRLTTVPGRMQRISTLTSEPLVIVDFAHTPAALKNALEALKYETNGRLICVFGCGGDRDKGKRPQMLTIAQKYCQKIILTQDNSRNEDPQKIISDILSDNKISSTPKRNNCVTIELNREKAIRNAILQANPKDLIFIAGKGNEEHHIIGKRQVYGSDMEFAKKSLALRDKL